MLRRTIASTLAALASLTLALAAPAAGKAPSTSTKSPLDQCSSYALGQSLDAWSCIGGQLSYVDQNAVDNQGKPAVVTTRVAADVKPNIATTQADYDSWCEFGTICTRKVSSYISETKGNAAYGDRDGVIGNFDVVIRTNLNGRQARWRVFWYHDNGPGLTFTQATIRCKKETWLPDSNCGQHFVDNGDGIINLGTGNYANPPTVYGNRIDDSDEYYGMVDAYFTPAGYVRYTMSPLRSALFNCYGTADNCYFP